MQTLLLEPGDLLQIKSTDLPSGSFIKLQPQSTAFLEISDPKAVLENVMRNFSCLTTGDVFSFAYNDQTYEMAVLETRPDTSKKAISVLETDLEVDFAPPVGYVEPNHGNTTSGLGTGRDSRTSGTSTPRSGVLPGGGVLHHQGTMAQAINYSSIAPASSSALAGTPSSSSVPTHFHSAGHKLSSGTNKKKALTINNSSTATPPPPAAAATAATNTAQQTRRRPTGPQPLRLPPGKLFFGYEIKPVRNSNADGDGDGDGEANKENRNHNDKPRFQGSGQTLRGGGSLGSGNGSGSNGKAGTKRKSGGGE